MAKADFVLNIGDDNVVLTLFKDGKVANAWLGSPDPSLAQEELGEALATEPKARISILFDTLDQSFKEEELPRVGVLDRRKVLARHINMAFPGANLRGARLVTQTQKKTLIYELASVPLDGRVPAWLDFVNSLPNENAGVYTIAGENADIIEALAPKDATPPEEGNHWRHFIGINVTGGLRQLIEKNGRLSLTRLTQAPPADTSPEDFGDMIIRDFKATITYIRRLGYQVGEALDLVVLTTAENKGVLEDMTWDGARSVSVYTPYEAGLMLGLGSLGREDQAFCDVLHAAWFVSKGKGRLALTRAAGLGDTRDDIRDLAYLAAPYAAGIMVAGLVGWSAWTGYEFYDYSTRNQALQTELSQLNGTLSARKDQLNGQKYTAAQVRNVLDVADTLDKGKIDLIPHLQHVADALQGDAVVMDFEILNASVAPTGPARPQASAGAKSDLTLLLNLRLDNVITSADEATQTARRLEKRFGETFGPGFKITMTQEPVGAQAVEQLTGSLANARSEAAVAAQEAPGQELFFAAYMIERTVP